MRKTVRQRFPYTDALWNNPKTEPEWHALRADDVTATDAAALFGLSPYCTLFELFHRKAGSIKVEFEETERMLWGKRLQDAIADGICEDRGWRILNRDPFLYARSMRFPGMGASPDYIVLDPVRGVGTLEIKNVDKFIAKDDWSDDEAPVHIEFQLQHQLECTALPWGAVGGLIGGNETRVFIRERDEEVGIEIGNRVTELWRRVREGDPPAPDYKVDGDTLKRLYRHAEVGKVIDLADPKHEAIAARVLALCEAERVAVAKKKMAKEDRENAQSVLRQVLADLCAAEIEAAQGAKAAANDDEAAKAELLDTVREYERVIGIPGFKFSAVTVHTAERTQVVRENSYRKLTVTKEKARV